MAEINIDATNAIAGRLASYAAKQALLGNNVNVLNCESAVFTGKPEYVKERYLKLTTDLGGPFKGPFRSRMPDRFFRRIVRGMVPWQKPRGREAFKRVMCYIGVPVQFKDRKIIKVEAADASKGNKGKTIPLIDVCRYVGARL